MIIRSWGAWACMGFSANELSLLCLPCPRLALDVPGFAFHMRAGDQALSFGVFLVCLHVDFVSILFPTTVLIKPSRRLVVQGAICLENGTRSNRHRNLCRPT